MTVKPLLLIDVDGVLVPFGTTARPAGFEAVEIDGVERWLNPSHGTWINDLAAWYEPVWATTWEHDAPRTIGVILGLPSMAVIEFVTSTNTKTWKLPDVDRFAGDRPLAWVDDDLHDDAGLWAAQRASPTLLIHTDPSIGLTQTQVGELSRFAKRIYEGRPPSPN